MKRNTDKKEQVSKEDFDNADKILKAMLKVPPPKKWK